MTTTTTHRVHIFLVEAPGARIVRMHVEAAAVRRGYVLASSPAAADALLVCGVPGPELSTAIERVWAQIPGPRSRGAITSLPDVDAVLTRLGDLENPNHPEGSDLPESPEHPAGPGYPEHPGHPGHPDGPEHSAAFGHPHDESAARPTPAADDHRGGHPPHAEPTGHDDVGMEGMDMHDHAGMGDMHDMHGGADMMHMHMAGPGGYQLAQGAEDRDGLRLDVLHRSFGPVLPDWPAGLTIHLTLAGDIVTAATMELLDSAQLTRSSPENTMFPAIRCDDAARLLTAAGWTWAANRLRRVRDLLLTADLDEASAFFRPVAGRIARSWVLGWSLRGVEAGDGISVRARLRGWLDDVRATLDHRIPPTATDTPAEVTELIIGRELSDARLIIAAQGFTLLPADGSADHESPTTLPGHEDKHGRNHHD